MKSSDDEKLCYVISCISLSALCDLFMYSLFNDAVSQSPYTYTDVERVADGV
jgi:hypothetical protein